MSITAVQTPTAFDLVELGWHLVAMPARQKNPGRYLGTNWQSKASVNIAQIDDWMRSLGNPNFGILLGPKSNLIDVEYDTPKGKDLLEQYCRDLQTPTYRSKKSVHRLFLYDDRFVAEKAFIGLFGTEWRFGQDAAQSVIPPSEHPEGPIYQWLPGLSPSDVSTVRLPDELWQLYLELKSRKQSEREAKNQRPHQTKHQGNSNEKLNVETWLERCQVEILASDDCDGLRRWFIACPNEGDHTNPTAVRDCCVTQEPSGKLGGNCFHTSCGMTNWNAIRDAIGELKSSDFGAIDSTPETASRTRSANSWLKDPESRTENELATRFVDENLRAIRFVPEWDCWLIWDGRRWKKDTTLTFIVRLARRFSKSLWQEFGSLASAHPSARDDLNSTRTFCRLANNERCIRSYLRLASADKRVGVEIEHLNAHPWKLNVLNGTLDFRTGSLEPHNPSDLLTQLASVEYRADASCPRWLDGLSLMFNRDDGLIRYLAQILGYATTADSGEHILPIAWGGGSNGKSTVTNVMLALLGEYAGLANDSLLLGMQHAHPTEKAFLYQKRFVPLSEPEQSSRLREARVKELTGDGTITARFMKEDFWSFRRSHSFWLSTNHLPKISGNDEGIWRRVKLIPFSVDLRKVTTPIPDLDKLLVREEGPGILNWLVNGFRDYQVNGFIEPECVKVATQEYRLQEDEIANFIDDCCVVEGKCIVNATQLFLAYESWGGKESQVVFGKAMLERFERARPDSGAYRKQTVYYGIGLLSTEVLK